MTQEELATRIGYKSKSSITHIEKGRDIPRSMVVKLADTLDTTPAYLMGWEDNSEKADSLSELIKQYDNIKPISLNRFPLLGEIVCGEPIFVNEDKESFVMADMDINADFCLTAKGDSMVNARIYGGDVVFIKEMPIVENGDTSNMLLVRSLELIIPKKRKN